MEEIKFTSLNELYKRVKPALTCRKEEIKRLKLSYVKEEDIWNYLKEKKWKMKTQLTLVDIVNDILEVDSYLLDEYIKDKMKKYQRTINLDEENLL